MNIVETWTRADVASRRGEWEKSIELWTKIKSFYEQYRHAPGSIQFIKECDMYIRRGRKYLNASLANRRSEPESRQSRSRSRMNRRKSEIPLRQPKPCRQIRDKTVDSIMMAFDHVATIHDTIQNSETISPPPLQESFYIVPSLSERPTKNVYEELMEANRKLRNLKEINEASFYNIKKAMENLSQENAYLFPDKLKSRYSILMEENKQLKSRLLKIKTDGQTSM